nr:hypothetical protein [Tanacetum cinerariifolium]
VNTPRSDEDRLKLMKLMVFLLQKDVCDDIGITVARLLNYCYQKLDAAEGFEQIIDFLSGSYIYYALTVSPHIYISCIKKFWNSISVKRSSDVTSQLKFLIHTILQSLSAKRTSWNEFSTAMASVVFCLSKGQRFNFSKYIFNSLGRMMNEDEGIELVKDAEIAESEGRHADKQAKIYNIDLDHSSKVLSMQEDDSEVQDMVEVVTTAKIITEVVTTAASQGSAASATIPTVSATIPAAPTIVAAYTRRRKGVIIRDPEEELPLKTSPETPKVKDKGKGILVEAPKHMNKKDQIEMDAEYARKLQQEIDRDHDGFNKDIDWDAAMDHVNQKSSSNPQFDENIRFLFKSREEMEAEDQEIIKSINETPIHKITKRRKLSEEAQEAKDLRKQLEVVEDEDDDVFVEATPLAQKLFLLVERRYLLSRFTLEQLVNVTRLQIEEKSEMSLELLRFTR